ncbi:MAG: SIMPL domain-containing protein [Bacteroidia bacterium]|nr:SIMPL domain-containing protein [Bacteroidia bacterium]
MKTLFFILALFIVSKIYSQDITQPMIEVTGSAEMSIIPDQIELEIILSSNYKSSKHSMDEVEKKFFSVLEAHNIPKMAVSFISMDNPYYWYYWWWDYRHYYDTKTYKLKFDCAKYDLSFIKDFDTDFIRSLRITQSTHSKITDYRRQVKVEAIKAAKEKAQVLLEAIGQKCGRVLEVIEIQEPILNNNSWYGNFNNNYSNMTSNSVMYQPSTGSGSGNSESHVPSIKLRFEIKTKFEIL